MAPTTMREGPPARLDYRCRMTRQMARGNHRLIERRVALRRPPLR